VRKADNLPPSCAIVMKSGNFYFLKPSGPVTGLLYFTLLYRLCSYVSNTVTENSHVSMYTYTEHICHAIEQVASYHHLTNPTAEYV